jgi:hypothetical protein
MTKSITEKAVALNKLFTSNEMGIHMPFSVRICVGQLIGVEDDYLFEVDKYPEFACNNAHKVVQFLEQNLEKLEHVFLLFTDEDYLTRWPVFISELADYPSDHIDTLDIKLLQFGNKAMWSKDDIILVRDLDALLEWKMPPVGNCIMGGPHWEEKAEKKWPGEK